MLVRPEGDDAVLCIGQASHAWISGQLARAWRGLTRREELCLAAEQHDVAWLAWDASPERDPETGAPYSFTRLPLPAWVALWGPAPERLATQSAYAALLLSLHGTRLRAGDPAAAGYRREQEALQERLLAQTGADRAEALRHRDLLAAWDGLSLALCLDWAPYEGDGIALRRRGEAYVLDPWPLEPDALEVSCEGRVLRGRPADDAALRAALRDAPLRTLRFALERPEG